MSFKEQQSLTKIFLVIQEISFFQAEISQKIKQKINIRRQRKGSE